MADAPRLLAVVAHPDDETFGFGSILAWAAAARAAELREAADRLGVSRVDLLDFAASGMVGNAVPGTLVAAPFEDVVAAVLAEVDAVRPSVVLTLDAATGTGTTRARALRHPVGRSQSGRAGRARLPLRLPRSAPSARRTRRSPPFWRPAPTWPPGGRPYGRTARRCPPTRTCPRTSKRTSSPRSGCTGWCRPGRAVRRRTPSSRRSVQP